MRTLGRVLPLFALAGVFAWIHAGAEAGWPGTASLGEAFRWWIPCEIVALGAALFLYAGMGHRDSTLPTFTITTVIVLVMATPMIAHITGSAWQMVTVFVFLFARMIAEYGDDVREKTAAVGVVTSGSGCLIWVLIGAVLLAGRMAVDDSSGSFVPGHAFLGVIYFSVSGAISYWAQARLHRYDALFGGKPRKNAPVEPDQETGPGWSVHSILSYVHPGGILFALGTLPPLVLFGWVATGAPGSGALAAPLESWIWVEYCAMVTVLLMCVAGCVMSGSVVVAPGQSVTRYVVPGAMAIGASVAAGIYPGPAVTGLILFVFLFGSRILGLYVILKVGGEERMMMGVFFFAIEFIGIIVAVFAGRGFFEALYGENGLGWIESSDDLALFLGLTYFGLVALAKFAIGSRMWRAQDS